MEVIRVISNLFIFFLRKDFISIKSIKRIKRTKRIKSIKSIKSQTSDFLLLSH